MDDDQASETREDRLAAKLRENLKRRKAQARALSGADGDDLPAAPQAGNALSKGAPKS